MQKLRTMTIFKNVFVSWMLQMMIGLFGYLSGYNGSFIFDVGKPYEDTPYIGMRIVSFKVIYLKNI